MTFSGIASASQTIEKKDDDALLGFENNPLHDEVVPDIQSTMQKLKQERDHFEKRCNYLSSEFGKDRHMVGVLQSENSIINAKIEELKKKQEHERVIKADDVLKTQALFEIMCGVMESALKRYRSTDVSAQRYSFFVDKLCLILDTVISVVKHRSTDLSPQFNRQLRHMHCMVTEELTGLFIWINSLTPEQTAYAALKTTLDIHKLGQTPEAELASCFGNGGVPETTTDSAFASNFCEETAPIASQDGESDLTGYEIDDTGIWVLKRNKNNEINNGVKTQQPEQTPDAELASCFDNGDIPETTTYDSVFHEEPKA